MDPDNQIAMLLKLVAAVLKGLAGIIMLAKISTLWGFQDFAAIGYLLLGSAILEIINTIMTRQK